MLTRWLKRPVASSNGRHPDADASLIELVNVVKIYDGSGVTYPALKGVSLQIARGEFVAIVGKSGSGKSTLINMLAGIDRPTSGSVLVGGTAVHTLSEEELAEWRGRTVGVVFQFFQLLPLLTAVENVMLPMDFCDVYAPRERRRRALRLLELVGMAQHADKLPSALSGGEQQRVAIARALANDPPILLADEPTGNLDSQTAEAVFALLQRVVADGKTVVMVTHDRDLARRAGRTVVIADGLIVSDQTGVAPAAAEAAALPRST